MAGQVDIPTASNLPQVAVNGGDLFRVALDHLGDALQWNRIAAANGLRDPFLPANTPLLLTIPPVNPDASDTGILGA